MTKEEQGIQTPHKIFLLLGFTNEGTENLIISVALTKKPPSLDPWGITSALYTYGKK